MVFQQWQEILRLRFPKNEFSEQTVRRLCSADKQKYSYCIYILHTSWMQHAKNCIDSHILVSDYWYISKKKLWFSTNLKVRSLLDISLNNIQLSKPSMMFVIQIQFHKALKINWCDDKIFFYVVLIEFKVKCYAAMQLYWSLKNPGVGLNLCRDSDRQTVHIELNCTAFHLQLHNFPMHWIFSPWKKEISTLDRLLLIPREDQICKIFSKPASRLTQIAGWLSDQTLQSGLQLVQEFRPATDHLPPSLPPSLPVFPRVATARVQQCSNVRMQ